VLLEGEIVAMGFVDATQDAFDFRFRVTGGELLSLFSGKDIGMRFTIEGSSFRGSFTENFAGDSIKGSLFAIPGDGLSTPDAIGSLGDRVWEDLDGDGVQDCMDANFNGIVGDAGDTGSECAAGIGNVEVALFDAVDGVCGNGDDASLGTTLTDAAGFYQFSQLSAGDYCVRVARPDAVCDFGDAAFTGQDEAGDDLLDSDVDADGRTGPIALVDGQQDMGWDAGVVCSARVGDLLFEDTDGDGSQTGEPAVDGTADPSYPAGLPVELYACDADGNRGTLVGTTTIDADGSYFFDVLPGRYEVVFTAPVDSSFTVANVSAAGDAADSDASLTGATGCIIDVASNEQDLSIDAGIVFPEPEPLFSRFGNLLFHDVNRNGIQDGGEDGIDGTLYPAPVEVYQNCGAVDEQLVGTYDIDAAGEYLTGDLLAGDYCARFTPPAGFCVDPATGIDHGTARFTLRDADDGAPDAEARDSDVDPDTGITGTIALPEDTTDLRWDAGVYCDARIGDRLWDDTAGIDGLQDADTAAEPGVPGAEVTLYACVAGTPDTSTGVTLQTDADGFYEFFAAPGSYAVGFSIPAALADLGYVFTLADRGTDDGFDSDADRNTGITGCFTVASRESDLSLDAGIFEPNASLGDTCFHDLNANGLQDQDEPGIDGCSVALYENADGGACEATEADFLSDVDTAGGLYLFENMLGGDYCLKVTPPADFCAAGEPRFSPQDAGDDALDSDVDAAGLTGNIALGWNETDLGWDAGLYCAARLGDRVFEDTNRDDRQNCADADQDGILGETNGDDTGAECGTGVDDVLVKLLTPGADGLCNTADDGDTGAAQLTSGGGLYLFDTDPGTYCIEIEPPQGYVCTGANVGADAGDSDVEPAVTGSGACRSSQTIVLPSNTEDRTWDAGIVIPAAPAIDLEKATNGFDADLPGTGPTLLIGDAVTWTYVITNTGNVDLVNVVVSDDIEGPVCTIDALAVDEIRTCELSGTADTTLYANTGSVVARPAYDPVDGPEVTDTDPSRYTASQPDPIPASLGNLAFEDLNRDGIQDSGEPGIAGVEITLTDPDGNSLTIATDANGEYWFRDLLPGIPYQVSCTAPVGYDYTPVFGQARADDTDSNADPATGEMGSYNLGDGEILPTVDCGLVRSEPEPEPEPEPEVCPVPSIDGDSGDWDLSGDFFAKLYEAGNPGKDHLANAYLRWSEGTLNVLVLATPGNAVSRSAQDAWVKVYDLSNSTLVDGSSASFAWVYENGALRGYEASFDLAAGSYDKIEIHLNVNGGDTASTGKKKQGYIAYTTEDSCSTQCPVDSGPCADGIDFSVDGTGNPLAKGADVSAAFAALGLRIRAEDRRGNPRVPMIFDSSDPSGGDWDLGTPNEQYGGPGRGSAGMTNDKALGNVVIVSEDGDASDPDDIVRGTLYFEFDQPVRVGALEILDVEASEIPGWARAYDADGNLLAEVIFAGLGDNSYQQVPLDVENVRVLEVYFRGSGAVGSLDFCPQPPQDCPAPEPTPEPDPQVCIPRIDFDVDATGNVLGAGADASTAYAASGVTISATDKRGRTRVPMIFDTADPTGGDWDLGTPNERFGGPGRGDGGASNTRALGKVLIVSEDGDASDPDDLRGGVITFDFDAPVRLSAVEILDVDRGETDGFVLALDAAGNEIARAPIADAGNNSFQVVSLDAANVRRLVVRFEGSGSVAGLTFCPDQDDAALAGAGAVVSGDILLEAEAGELGRRWEVHHDGAASDGAYLTVERGRNKYRKQDHKGIARYHFDVTAPGTYRLWGRVITPGDRDDSFWVRVNGGDWVKWNGIDWADTWHWDSLHDNDDGNRGVLLSLPAGANTLEIAYREDGAKLDQILLTADLGLDPNVQPPAAAAAAAADAGSAPAGPFALTLEAEDGELGRWWRTHADPDAAGGRYLEIKGGKTSTRRPHRSHKGRASYAFEVDRAGVYTVFGRVIAPSGGDDSFWVRIDGGDWVRWNGIERGRNWTWDQVHDADAGDAPLETYLEAGQHTLEVAYREDGTKLDRWLITDDLTANPSLGL